MNKTLTACLLLLLLLTSGCATKPPTLQEGPDAEVTFDGLVRVDNSVFQRAWADPDIDLSRYKKIIPVRAEVEFRAVRTGSAATRNSGQREFPISEANQQKLIDIFSETFSEELAKSTRFTITDQPGPDVLFLRGSLLDIISLVPPQTAGRTEVYLSRVAEATLVLELIDSQSNETLVRAAERRAAERAGQTGMYSNPATNWNEVRRLARRWAVTLREGLDAAAAPAT